jgi:hypothetical protein
LLSASGNSGFIIDLFEAQVGQAKLALDFSISLIRRTCFTPCQPHELLVTFMLAIRHTSKSKENQKKRIIMLKGLGFRKNANK